MKKKLFIKKVFLLFCFNGLIFLIFQLFPGGVLISIRTALFSQKLPDKFYSTYHARDGLRQYGFIQTGLRYQDQTLNKEILREKIQATSSLDSSKEIALSFSKNGEDGGCGEKSDNLIDNILWISQGHGHGCCSDHAQAFLAYSIYNGLTVREVNNLAHTFNEFYDYKYQKWVWIDPEFCLLARSRNGEYLSSLDILDFYAHHKPFDYIFFGNINHILFHKPVFPTYDCLGGPEPFGAVIITNGNNVFEVNYWNAKLTILPRSVRQFLLISCGIQPSYLLYNPNRSIWEKLLFIKGLILIFLLLLIYSNIWLWRFMTKKFNS